MTLSLPSRCIKSTRGGMAGRLVETTVSMAWRRRQSRPVVVADLTPINGHEVLEKLAALRISAWNYKFDDASIHHLGPMAQDFFATFGLGGDDKTINIVDANGVVMIAIQA